MISIMQGGIAFEDPYCFCSCNCGVCNGGIEVHEQTVNPEYKAGYDDGYTQSDSNDNNI